jgi:CubicO group peptidase (beta-lactamase class C family)
MCRRLVLSAILLSVVGAFSAIAQTSTTSASTSVAPIAIDSLAQEALRRQHLPALTLAVIDHGQIVYSRAFGFADLENQVAATPASEIRTASIAKPMTAIAAMQLAETGKLNLDAPVQQYCPAFPAKTSPDGKPWVVTTRELLSHRAGVRWYRDDMEQKNNKHYATLDEAVRHFGDEPLLFSPGEKMQYSSYGYVVAGCAIEGATHERFTSYMQQAVFAPAGMTATLPDDPTRIIAHRASGYERAKGGGLENAPAFDPSDRLPGGGWLSTSEDLVRFANAVMSDKLVPHTVLEQMWTPSTVEPDGNGYGLGWGIASLDGHRIVGHNGGQAGTSTTLKLLPERKLAVAIMTNVEGAPLDNLAHAILKLYLSSPSAGYKSQN